MAKNLNVSDINELKKMLYITEIIDNEKILQRASTIDELKNLNLITKCDPSASIEESLNPGPSPEPIIYEDSIVFWTEDDENTAKLSYAGSANFSYSYDNKTWNTWDKELLDFSYSNPVYIKGDNPNGLGPSEVKFTTYVSVGTPKVHCGGNIMSLLGENVTNLPSYAFYNLFSGNSLVDASKLILPATELAQSCYSGMFEGCSLLTTAPELPATTLAQGCYSYMFNGCTSLTSAPELPATVLTPSCYQNMFEGCTSLTQAPELPATVLVNYCYRSMFFECTSLTQAPELPATALAQSCYSNMFSYCTNLTTAPELPATVLAQSCYSNMFEGCTSLNSVTCWATALASNSTYGWLYNVSPTGTFTGKSTANWPDGDSGIPNGWTKNLS